MSVDELQILLQPTCPDNGALKTTNIDAEVQAQRFNDWVKTKLPVTGLRPFFSKISKLIAKKQKEAKDAAANKAVDKNKAQAQTQDAAPLESANAETTVPKQTSVSWRSCFNRFSSNATKVASRFNDIGRLAAAPCAVTAAAAAAAAKENVSSGSYCHDCVRSVSAVVVKAAEQSASLATQAARTASLAASAAAGTAAAGTASLAASAAEQSASLATKAARTTAAAAGTARSVVSAAAGTAATDIASLATQAARTASLAASAAAGTAAAGTASLAASAAAGTASLATEAALTTAAAAGTARSVVSAAAGTAAASTASLAASAAAAARTASSLVTAATDIASSAVTAAEVEAAKAINNKAAEEIRNQIENSDLTVLLALREMIGMPEEDVKALSEKYNVSDKNSGAENTDEEKALALRVEFLRLGFTLSHVQPIISRVLIEKEATADAAAAAKAKAQAVNTKNRKEVQRIMSIPTPFTDAAAAATLLAESKEQEIMADEESFDRPSIDAAAKAEKKAEEAAKVIDVVKGVAAIATDAAVAAAAKKVDQVKVAAEAKASAAAEASAAAAEAAAKAPDTAAKYRSNAEANAEENVIKRSGGMAWSFGVKNCRPPSHHDKESTNHRLYVDFEEEEEQRRVSNLTGEMLYREICDRTDGCEPNEGELINSECKPNSRLFIAGEEAYKKGAELVQNVCKRMKTEHSVAAEAKAAAKVAAAAAAKVAAAKSVTKAANKADVVITSSLLNGSFRLWKDNAKVVAAAEAKAAAKAAENARIQQRSVMAEKKHIESRKNLERSHNGFGGSERFKKPYLT